MNRGTLNFLVLYISSILRREPNRKQVLGPTEILLGCWKGLFRFLVNFFGECLSMRLLRIGELFVSGGETEELLEFRV